MEILIAGGINFSINSVNTKMNNDDQNPRSSSTDGTGNRNEKDKFEESKYSVDSTGKISDGDEFPGYPHYPPSEDIMNPANQVERVPVDVEKLAPTGSIPKIPAAAAGSAKEGGGEDDIKIVSGTDADVTREDLHLLSATEGPYADVSNTTTVTGEDLDVPGADEDDSNEDIGEEDEENNYYSLGGDNHENLEEDPS